MVLEKYNLNIEGILPSCKKKVKYQFWNFGKKSIGGNIREHPQL